MSGNLENLIRQKVTFLCPVSGYNFCLPNWQPGQGTLLPRLPQQSSGGTGGSAIPVAPCRSWVLPEQQDGSRTRTLPGCWEILALCAPSPALQFSGAEWLQYLRWQAPKYPPNVPQISPKCPPNIPQMSPSARDLSGIARQRGKALKGRSTPHPPSPAPWGAAGREAEVSQQCTKTWASSLGLGRFFSCHCFVLNC